MTESFILQIYFLMGGGGKQQEDEKNGEAKRV